MKIKQTILFIILLNIQLLFAITPKELYSDSFQNCERMIFETNNDILHPKYEKRFRNIAEIFQKSSYKRSVRVVKSFYGHNNRFYDRYRRKYQIKKQEYQLWKKMDVRCVKTVRKA